MIAKPDSQLRLGGLLAQYAGHIAPLRAGRGHLTPKKGQVAVRSTGQNPHALSMPVNMLDTPALKIKQLLLLSPESRILFYFQVSLHGVGLAGLEGNHIIQRIGRLDADHAQPFVITKIRHG